MRRVALFALLVVLPVALPAQAPANAIKSPDEAFGFRMGTDRQLAGSADAIQQLLRGRRGRVGPRRADRSRADHRRPPTDRRHHLARPRTSRASTRSAAPTCASPIPERSAPDDARTLAATQQVIVAIGASIHATEIGATQAANELLHTLATSTDARDRSTCCSNVGRRSCIPSLNPDGHRLVVDWYRKWKGTPFEGGPMPWLYHKYAGHDINRDAFMMNLAENRNLARFFYTRLASAGVPDDAPDGDARAALLRAAQLRSDRSRTTTRSSGATAGLLGDAMALALRARRPQPASCQNAMYDYYWPGYEDSAPLGHNTVCLLTEVGEREGRDADHGQRRAICAAATRGLPEYRAQINFPNPWPGGAGRSATSSTTT